MEAEKEAGKVSVIREKAIRRVLGYRLLDDEFMKAVFRDNNPAATLVLRIILNKPDIVAETVDIEEKELNFIGRSVSVDILAREKGRIYNIEIQRSDVGAIPRRARFHGSVIDTNELRKGSTFDMLPETYVIFITENDIYGKGLPVYTVDRKVSETGQDFGDGLHIVYANGQYRGDDDMGRLMRDFSCTNAADMTYNELAERVRYLKETEEGLVSMSRTIEEFGKECRAEGLEEGLEQGRAEGLAIGADRLGRLLSKLFEQNRVDDAKKASSDSAFREKLFKEFGIA